MRKNPVTEPKDERDLVLVKQEEVPLDGSDTSNEDGIIKQPFDPTRIRVEIKNTQMDTLIKRLRNDEIDLEPAFQRKAGIWKDSAQSKLIESMLIKIPLPGFYMDATDESNWLVVDGLQRLTAIKRFVIDKTLALTGLEFLTDFNQKHYDDLPRTLKRRIEETDVVIYQIQPGTPERVKFDIFRRINTGGEPLSAQEIRHALNQGKITKFLERVANSIEFKIATDYGISPKRMDDRECVLRFIAFSMFPPNDYKEDNFDAFLNDTMAYCNKMSDAELETIENRFLRAMTAAKRIFFSDAFRKRYHLNSVRYPVNKALFEAWSVNLDSCSDDDLQKLAEKNEELRITYVNALYKDYEFDKSVSQGTGSIKRVKKRFQTVRAIIEETLI